MEKNKSTGIEYGYARISTPKQSLARQIRDIAAVYPNATIVEEIYTGTSPNRPEWDKLKKKLRAGDTLICVEVSRFSRSEDDGVSTYMELFDRGINLVFLWQPTVNSDVYRSAIEKDTIPMTGTDVDIILSAINVYLKRVAEAQIRLAFQRSELEVRDLRKRTRDGMAAKGSGAKIAEARSGRRFPTKKEKTAIPIILKHSKSFGGSLNNAELMALCNCSAATLKKYKNIARAIQEKTVLENEE